MRSYNKRADHGSSGILYTLLNQNESDSLLSQSEIMDDDYLTSINARPDSIRRSQSFNVSICSKCIPKSYICFDWDKKKNNYVDNKPQTIVFLLCAVI